MSMPHETMYFTDEEAKRGGFIGDSSFENDFTYGGRTFGFGRFGSRSYGSTTFGGESAGRFIWQC